MKYQRKLANGVAELKTVGVDSSVQEKLLEDITANLKDLFAAINEGGRKPRGKLWYFLGRYLYVPIAIILCVIALAMKVAF